MKLFDVYPLIDVTPAKAEGSYFWDENGTEYLDLYGGHAVISIGHSHPTYVKYITEQLNNIGFYSNYVKIPIQNQVAEQLTKLSGYDDYTLFLCNSGAEANENAIKLASFHTGKKKIIYFSGAFHGRTAAAVACTDNPKIVAPVNQSENFIKLPFNDLEALENEFKTNSDIAGVIVEGIQGVGGVQIPTTEFLQKIHQLCNENNAVFIADEIQSGFGRSGKFFAHQNAGVTPDIIAMAKGMGNGFPVAGILISPKFKASYGLLGTTFGGNFLACAATKAVLEVIEKENLLQNAQEVGDYLVSLLQNQKNIKEIRYQGLMIGIDLAFPCNEVRTRLVKEYKMLTGNASTPNTLRVLPALNVKKEDVKKFADALIQILNEY
ncbi:aspartate aminotransferase family protein [Cloacibacterium normanense]|uniref:Aminotransferase class-III family protein n=1 Tax=Cloacibacterium normanense TaxID=237258 RepID=A0A1E5UH91_9FLAO|nr:aminotransferase class III-fold pyridoxal phosphate-dependent enzyme [Cloacibacterium normanense]AZI69033.1 aminotransferase class III-fold pyridoxal phosphate-dependent enzyme [Cloacibacterium normanense]OEL12260.1 aminotransferase class-III family protein [Cloacibacterium normanense]SDO60780.1 acetylornithine aminotransferase [Cloacibacterium normanense]